jgi:hypothetical protein
MLSGGHPGRAREYRPDVQSLASAAIRRPFHWGVVILTDADSEALTPDVVPGSLISSNEHGIVALVRHAQDIDSSEDTADWAETEIVVRLLSAAEAPSVDRREVFRGGLHLPSGRLSIGDADSDVIHPAHRGWNELVITVAADLSPTDLSPDQLRIDLLPAG